MRVTIVLATILCNLGVARADLPRCSQVQVPLSYHAQDLPDASGDTGWFPDGSPAQLRLTGQLEGQTDVALTLTPTACWEGGGMTIRAPGVAGSGLLDSEYGADFQLLGQIHTSVLGYHYDWEGNIPLPYWLPNDLLMAGTTQFDPGTPVASVTSNETSPVVLLSTDILSDIIDIIGISGGLRLTAQGQMTTSYWTNAIHVGGGSIDDANGAVSVGQPDGGFAASLGEAITADGTVEYDPYVILGANFYVSILHVTVVNWTLASIELPLPSIDRDVTLTGSPLAIPLPRLDPLPTTLGFATGATQQLKLHNAGQMALAVQVDSAPAGVTAAPITIAPGEDGTLEVTAASPDALGGESLVLATNDPSHPSLDVALDPAKSGETTTSPDGEDSGCNAGGRAGWPLAALALGLVLVRRRRVR